MLTTMELRWFYYGALPPTIAHWFQQDDLGQHLEPPKARDDLYLYISECDYLGIKLRQGRLEIKWRQEALDVLHFTNQSKGKPEKWVKWTCADATEGGVVPEAMVAKGPWVKVAKSRSQRKYHILADQSLAAVPVNEMIDQGCTVELAELGVMDTAWWSLAFEAVGEEANLMHTLQVVSSWVIKTYSGPELQAQNSYAYPQWLSTISQQ